MYINGQYDSKNDFMLFAMIKKKSKPSNKFQPRLNNFPTFFSVIAI